jgi:cellulose synthase/poly-beta-1,6-N-acetylglucosamine synthase-like glycosyltransferase
MKLTCIIPVRNEDWVLGLSARAVLQWCDELIVLNHNSADRTVHILCDIATEYPGRCLWFTQTDTEWVEMEHRQHLLDLARKRGATHIAMVDADEVLSANLIPDIRRMIEDMPAGMTMQLPWLCLRDTIYQVHRSGIWGQAFASMAFVDSPECHWSSAERGGYQYHHRHPMGRALIPYRPVGRNVGGLMHLQFVDDRRLRAKQCLYKMQEVVRWPGRQTAAQINATYNPAVYGRDTWCDVFDLAPVPVPWWKGYESLMRYMDPAAEPWQEAEVQRLYAEHGAAKFAGLDLFGVVPGVR